MDNNQELFRKKTIDRISSPEKLTDYLRVTNPGVWVVLACVVVLMIGIFAWAAIGTLETKAEATVVVEDHSAVIVTVEGETITEGMPLRISGQEYVIALTKPDEYGRTIGIAEVNLPNGSYNGTVIVEQTHPIDFLLMGSDSL